jgi:hypothetical protein
MEVVQTKNQNQQQSDGARRASASPLSLADRYNRKLALALSQVFLLSDEQASVATISEVICSRLSEQEEAGGAIGYLTACYKRLVQKASTSQDDKLKSDLDRCRGQVVSFMFTSIDAPEIFGSNSANSIDDFVRFLAAERSSIASSILRELAEELVGQGCLESVADKLFGRCFDNLNSGGSAASYSLFGACELIRIGVC